MDKAFVLEKYKTELELEKSKKDLESANEYIQSLLKENEELKSKNKKLTKKLKTIATVIDVLEQYENRRRYHIREESEESIFDKITDFIF